MLAQFLSDPLLLGLAQAGVASLLALLVVLAARRQAIHLERETIVALLRGIVQVVAVGAVLVLLLQTPLWAGVLVLLAMSMLAAQIAGRRAPGMPGAFWVSLQGIGWGAGLVILTMTLFGVIEAEMSTLIPIGSMLVANSMNTSALALERFRAEIEAHTGQIEAALALGIAPAQAVSRYTQAAVQASLIPRIDSLRSLGIVWIPGVMAGMILAGSDPVQAAIYQFVVIAMIFAGSGLTALISVLLIRRQAFSPSEQLILRANSGQAGNKN
jgi:putative ABC transport system permease protein